MDDDHPKSDDEQRYYDDLLGLPNDNPPYLDEDDDDIPFVDGVPF